MKFTYACGCSAEGPGELPIYCPEHKVSFQGMASRPPDDTPPEYVKVPLTLEMLDRLLEMCTGKPGHMQCRAKPRILQVRRLILGS